MTKLTLDKKLLVYLNEVGTGRYRDLKIFICDNLPAPHSESEIYTQLKSIWEFLDALQKQQFIQVDFDFQKAKEEVMVSSKYMTPIRAMILKGGINYLSQTTSNSSKTHVEFHAQNINYTGSIGDSNNIGIGQSEKSKKKNGLIPKLTKWVALLTAISALVFGIIKGALFINEESSKSLLLRDKSDSLKTRSDTGKMQIIHLNSADSSAASGGGLPEYNSKTEDIRTHDTAKYIPINDVLISRLTEYIPNKNCLISLQAREMDFKFIRELAEKLTFLGYKDVAIKRMEDVVAEGKATFATFKKVNSVCVIRIGTKYFLEAYNSAEPSI